MTQRIKKSVYFVGIGGIGMSALARYFKARNWAVSGSDAADGPIVASLRKEAIRVKIGHKRANLPAKTDLLVYNRAIPKDNPELAAARARGVCSFPYAEVLGAITKEYKTVAITGSHGKSTTTALAGLALMAAGMDPTILIGTNLRELGNKNIRMGRGQYLVLEADDFGAAFTHYSPAIAIVTNIDREHLDFYKTFGALQRAFLDFLANTRVGGMFILNRDDAPLWSLRARIAKIARRNNVRVTWYSLRNPAATKVRRAMQLPGQHNLLNALAVYELARILGIPERKTLAALGSYHGAWRRMEYRGMFGGMHGAPVYDDYAHHPTEIKATLKAFKERYPGKKILCVFQPHQAKRLAALFREFITAFADADKTLLLPVYNVAGRDAAGREAQNKKSLRNSAALARAIQKREPRKLFFYLADPRRVKDAVGTLAAPLAEHVIIMMGAGDIVQLTTLLIGKK